MLCKLNRLGVQRDRNLWSCDDWKEYSPEDQPFFFSIFPNETTAVRNMFRPVPGFITCTGVTRRWNYYLMEEMWSDGGYLWLVEASKNV